MYAVCYFLHTLNVKHIFKLAAIRLHGCVAQRTQPHDNLRNSYFGFMEIMTKHKTSAKPSYEKKTSIETEFTRLLCDQYMYLAQRCIIFLALSSISMANTCLEYREKRKFVTVLSSNDACQNILHYILVCIFCGFLEIGQNNSAEFHNSATTKIQIC